MSNPKPNYKLSPINFVQPLYIVITGMVSKPHFDQFNVELTKREEIVRSEPRALLPIIEVGLMQQVVIYDRPVGGLDLVAYKLRHGYNQLTVLGDSIIVASSGSPVLGNHPGLVIPGVGSVVIAWLGTSKINHLNLTHGWKLKQHE